MLVNSNNMLLRAFKEGYAIGHYNINNLEWTRFILEACNEDKSPVILGVSENAIKHFGGYKTVYNVVKSLIDDLNINIPVCLHLDHGKSFESCKNAIDCGFTSVMIDLSNLSFEENVETTKKVKEYALGKDVSVEAELGTLKGNEDGITNTITYADPDLCEAFVSQTKIDSLAPAIGNKHGFYNEDDKIDFELLGLICKKVKLPLVLHGGSGLDDNKLSTAIFCGVCKININTDLKYAWSNHVRKYLLENEKEYDPIRIINSGGQAIKQIIHERNRVFGCKNKAN